MSKKMTKEEANELRLVAAEIVARLHGAKEINQLRMLEIQTVQCVKLLKEAGVKPSF